MISQQEATQIIADVIELLAALAHVDTHTPAIQREIPPGSGHMVDVRPAVTTYAGSLITSAQTQDAIAEQVARAHRLLTPVHEALQEAAAAAAAPPAAEPPAAAPAVDATAPPAQ